MNEWCGGTPPLPRGVTITFSERAATQSNKQLCIGPNLHAWGSKVCLSVKSNCSKFTSIAMAESSCMSFIKRYLVPSHAELYLKMHPIGSDLSCTEACFTICFVTLFFIVFCLSAFLFQTLTYLFSQLFFVVQISNPSKVFLLLFVILPKEDRPMYMNQSINQWMNESMNQWTNVRMNEWMNE